MGSEGFWYHPETETKEDQFGFTSGTVEGFILFQDGHEASWRQRDSQEALERGQLRFAEVWS